MKKILGSILFSGLPILLFPAYLSAQPAPSPGVPDDYVHRTSATFGEDTLPRAFAGSVVAVGSTTFVQCTWLETWDLEIGVSLLGDAGKAKLSGTKTSVPQAAECGYYNVPINISIDLSVSGDVIQGSYSTPFCGEACGQYRLNFMGTRSGTTINGSLNILAIGLGESGGQQGSFVLTPPLGITEVKFLHQNVSSGDWEPVDSEGTVDGNRVRIVATVENLSTRDQTAVVHFLDAETLNDLPGPSGLVATTIPAGASEDFTYVWDTAGFAWFGDPAQPHSNRMVSVIAAVDFGVADSEEDPIKVGPKPVIFVHGFVSNAGTWAGWYPFLPDAHPDWLGFAVGDHKYLGATTMNTGTWSDPTAQTNTIVQNAEILNDYIEAVRTDKNAWHVDLVAHSMGGLISRQYIQDFMPSLPDNPRPIASHLVMLGTPNLGTTCADAAAMLLRKLEPFFWFPATKELQKASVAKFNANVTDRRGVPFSILAGNPYSFTCLDLNSPGDTAVPVYSAISGITDLKIVDLKHEDMTASPEEVFHSFVYPRLALDPVAVKNAVDRGLAAANDGAGASLSSMSRSTTPSEPQVFLAEVANVPAAGSIDVTISVPAGSHFGVTLLAPGTTGSTLLRPTGDVAETIEPGSVLAKQLFRTMVVESPAVGNWTLRLSQTAATQVLVGIIAWIVENPIVLDLAIGAPDRGRVAITGTLSDAGSPVTGAALTAIVRETTGSETSIDLFDDGQHGDGRASDGTYSARTGTLAPGSYLVVLRATGVGFSRITNGIVEIPGAPDALAPANVWIGLANSDDVGIRFDLKAEVYRNGTELIGSGQLASAPGGSSGFNDAKLDSIPLELTGPQRMSPGDTLSFRLLVRNACSGSGKNSGRARLWFNDSGGNSHFSATLNGATSDYFLTDPSVLTTIPGRGPRKTIDVQAGAKCSGFKPFGTWSTTLEAP